MKKKYICTRCPEKNRIKYISKKLKAWEKSIKQVATIPSTIRYFRSRGYSNLFLELTIARKIRGSLVAFGSFSLLLGQCLCCGSNLCECEPNRHLHDGGANSDSYHRLREIDLADWMERGGFCVCGHRPEVHQIGCITDGGITIPYECRAHDCDCYYNLSNKTTGDYMK